MSLARAIEWVLNREGGFVDHPEDRGGPTNFGISTRSYPNLDIKNLTREQAIEIYERDYARPVGAHRLPTPLALAMLDYAVHSGPKRALRDLAVMLELPRDATLDQIVERVRQVPDARIVAIELVVERAMFLVRRALVTPGQDVFAKGWVSRMVELKRAVEEMKT